MVRPRKASSATTRREARAAEPTSGRATSIEGARGSIDCAGSATNPALYEEEARELQVDHHPVSSALFFDPIELAEHLSAQVGKHHASSADPGAISFELRIVDVEADLGLPVAALAEEEIDVGRATHEFLGPAGISRVDNRLAVDGGPSRRATARAPGAAPRTARSRTARERRRSRRRPVSGSGAGKVDRPKTLSLYMARKRSHRPLLGASRTRDQQLSFPRPLVEILHDHERNTAEMVSVEVAE